jgi:hypothetical protein
MSDLKKRTLLIVIRMLVVSWTMEEFVPEIRKIRYASLILTPFKAADNSALKNNSSVLDPRSTTKNLSTQKIVTMRKMEIWSGMFFLDPGSRFFLFWIPDAVLKKDPDPGPAYATLLAKSNR